MWPKAKTTPPPVKQHVWAKWIDRDIKVTLKIPHGFQYRTKEYEENIQERFCTQCNLRQTSEEFKTKGDTACSN